MSAIALPSAAQRVGVGSGGTYAWDRHSGGDLFPDDGQAVATDAAGNLSSYSSTATATTTAPDTTPPSTPAGLAATAAGTTQINLAWTASTDNVGVTGYRVERCAGAGCTTFAQVGAPTGTTFSDSGLTASTSYTYRVRATDVAGNLSGYSSTASATTATPDTTPPTAPTGLTATAISSAQINLAWTAATDDVAVTGYRLERCAGVGCSNFAQVATPTGTTFNNTGLAPATTYGYRVRAVDAAGNLKVTTGTGVSSTVPTIIEDQIRAWTLSGQTFSATTGKQTAAGAINAGVSLFNPKAMD